MKRQQRLRRNEDFRRVREGASRPIAHPLVLLFAVSNGLDRSRVGITVARRVGNAVTRNRVRRRIREAVRLQYGRLSSGYDLVFVARAPSAQATWGDLQAGVETLLTRAGLWATSATPALA